MSWAHYTLRGEENELLGIGNNSNPGLDVLLFHLYHYRHRRRLPFPCRLSVHFLGRQAAQCSQSQVEGS